MENTPKNNSNQNELDLDLNQADSATVRKDVKIDPSILNKVTGLFGKKETSQPNQFAVRKEPTFGTQPNPTTAAPNAVPSMSQNVTNYATSSTPQQENYLKTTQNIEQPANRVDTVQAQQSVATRPTIAQTAAQSETTNSVENTTTSATPNNRAEFVEPEPEQKQQPTAVPPVQEKNNSKNPENWGIMQKLPPKHRRLFIAIAGAIAILLALLWLKPSNNTVEEIQANNTSSTPIEFQSLDPNKPLENTEVANNNVVTEHTTPTDNMVENVNPTTQANEPTQSAQQIQPNTVQSNVTPEPVKPTETQTIVQNKVETQQVQTHSVEQTKNAEPQAQVHKIEQAKSATQQAQTHKVEPTKQAVTKTKAAPVVEAKPVSSSSQSNASSNQTRNVTNANTRTLVIPASTSLFQVFRSNGLDIRDANAMTKANGAGNVLSSFKANDKVQVAVSQGHVSTMRLSNGATFTRQTDGTYKYSK
ncbi:LysM-like peptidoglycan-binding domain-containing protein [Lonepinella sp. MS14436]|uniref:LysM-like peptidoglycan-binding domain-containing protein n=1 Tax=Lonepinella sp. MS14436 TaxID=3003619 RepID=UPI0036D7B00B